MTKPPSFIQTRSFLMSNVDTMLEYLAAKRKSKHIQSNDLFGFEEENTSLSVPWKKEVPLKPKFDILLEEKNSLGLYVSGNPLEEYRSLLDWCRQTTYLEDTLHLVLVEKVKKIFTRKGGMMLALQITTPFEQLEGLVFTKKAQKFSPILEEKEMFWILGKINRKEKKEVAEEMQPVENTDEEIKEFDEIPRLIIDEIVPFDQGVLELLNKTDIYLANNRVDVLSAVNWSNLKGNPNDLYSKKPEPETKTNTVKLRLPMSLGTIKLKEIKNLLKKAPDKNSTAVEIELETSQGWKKAKGNFWIDNSLLQKEFDDFRIG